MHSPLRPHPVSGAQGDAEAHRRNYQVMRVKYDKTEEKLAEFRERLKETRLELSTKDRQLDVAKRMLQRIQGEKSDAEMVSEKGRAQLKKLEAKLHHSDKSDLQTKHLRLKAKFTDQKEQMQENESRMRVAEETSLQLSQEVHLLKSALGLKNGMDGGVLGSQARLLHQLSKSQEESTSLAVQMAEGQNHLLEVKDQLERSYREISRLQKSRVDLDTELDETRQQVSESLETAALFRREAEQHRANLCVAQAALEEMTASRKRVDQQLRASEQQSLFHQEKAKQLVDRLQSVERASRLSIEALRTEVTIAVERAESRASEQRAGWAVREATLSDQCLTLKRELGDAQGLMVVTEQGHRAELGSMKQLVAAMEVEVDAVHAREREHMMEVGRLHGHTDTMTEINRVLKQSLDSAEDRAAAASGQARDAAADMEDLREVSGKLQARIVALEAQIQTLCEERDASEGDLRDQVKSLRNDLAIATLTGDKVKADSREVRRQAAEVDSRSDNMDAYVQELLQTIEALTDSKNKLQSYMLEQVTTFKTKLQRAEEDNKQLRQAVNAAQGLAPSPRHKTYTAVSSPTRTGYREDSRDSERHTVSQISRDGVRRSGPSPSRYNHTHAATVMEDSDDDDLAGGTRYSSRERASQVNIYGRYSRPS